eukprot:Em0013g416a
MGLKTPVSRQLLLRGKPDTFENAIEAAREIELVLEFESKPMELNAKISSVEDCDTGLQAALKDLMERLGNMEAQIQSVVQIVQCSVAAGISKTKAEARGTEQEAGRRHVRPVSYDDRRRSRRMCCFRCGEEGHIKRFCPLNFNGPAGTANGSRLGARCMNVRQYRDPLHFGCNVSNINSLLCIDGNVGKRSVNMLLDSGAAVSVIRSGVLEDRSRNLVNKAVMDFRNNKLHLGNSTIKIPSSDVSISSDDAHSISVHALEDMDIPGRSVRLVIATLQKGSCGSTEQISEGLIEPATVLPKHLCVARSLGRVLSEGSILVQVMNRNLILMESNVATVGSGNRREVTTFNLDSTEIPDSEKYELRNLLRKFGDLFVSENGALGRTKVVKHRINTSGSPIRQPLRRQPESLKGDMNEEVKKMLSRGVIRPSSSPWSSPIVMVRKKNGSWRFCIDYRKLNAVTHQDVYPLDAILESLAGSTLFTTLDLASGYWQVEIEEDDKEKTAFSTEKGHFEFNVMPFGLTNAPATFQRLMECILAGLTGEQCLIYIDDIIVFSASFPEHLERLTNVFLKLQDAGLKLKTEKCKFVQKAVKYLGHVVSAEGICPDPAKTEVVVSYPVPTSAKEVKQFMGLCNYYRRFVKDYSKIAAPLFKLLSKDASDAAIGAVLSQVQGGTERVIAYWSRKLQKAERNYSTTEREALAVVASLKEFYPYVYGFPCKLITDHNPLTSLKGIKDVVGRLTRWLLFLQQFNLDFQYKPGRLHTNADTLSRIPSRDNTVAAIEELISEDTLHTFLKAQEEDPA